MALPPTPQDSGAAQSVDESIRQVGGDLPTEVQPQKRQAIYKLDPTTKVPVSKYEGNAWKSRRDAGRKSIAHLTDGWEEAEYYYDNAQQNHRKITQGNRAGTRNYGKDRRDSFSMTENIVYATVNAVIPNVYAKNPSIEVTMTDPNAERLGLALKHLGNRIAEMRAAPGINLKPKMRKCILRTEVTNEAWVLIGWTKREDSADQARADIARIGKELETAQDAQTIENLEGQLLALEEQIDLLDPPGPFVKTLRSVDVLVDPASIEDDFSDANWKMVCVMESTKYLNARYRQVDKDGNAISAYEASHVVDAVAPSSNVQGMQEQLDNFKLFDSTKDDPKSYGYEDRESYERAKRTAVWYCFDKVKRRFYMYSDKDWTWPIWVFDDPYHFPDFYPLERLQWHPSPTSPRTRGEVSHYLDQQDEINIIIDELNRARVAMRDKTLFNSRVISTKMIEDIFNNPNKKLVGIPIPDGHKLLDHIMAPPQPNMELAHLWDKAPAKAAVNMLSGLGEAMRGEQFKTNTTNQAIQEYSSISNTRLDEKRDAVEDFIGAIMWKVLFLCMQFMEEDQFRELTGNQFSDVSWRKLPFDQIRHAIQCRVEGGSTQKPTSAAKKQEALQIGQILGQFASATPVAVLLAVKVFQRAFDGFIITPDEMNMLVQSVQAALQQQQQPQGDPEEAGETAPDDEAKEEAAVQEMMKQGMPEAEARKRVAQAKNGSVH